MSQREFGSCSKRKSKKIVCSFEKTQAGWGRSWQELQGRRTMVPLTALLPPPEPLDLSKGNWTPTACWGQETEKQTAESKRHTGRKTKGSYNPWRQHYCIRQGAWTSWKRSSRQKQQEEYGREELCDRVRRWYSSNHQCLLFSSTCLCGVHVCKCVYTCVSFSFLFLPFLVIHCVIQNMANMW